MNKYQTVHKGLNCTLSNAPQSGDPATALGQKHVKITKNIHQKSIKNPSKIHQKSIPNPSKNDQKSIQNPQKSILEAIRAFWSENVDFKGVPGAFWEVSWLRLGASWRCLGGVQNVSWRLLGRLGPSWGRLRLDFLAKCSKIEAFHLGLHFLIDF